MKASASSMIISALLLTLPTLATAQQTYFTNAVNERAVPCPDDPNQIGYKHIIDVNVDQRTELARIANGEAARKPYVFPFCNRFKFLIEQEILQVLLDEVTFVCGYNGNNDELCVLEGGSNQVNIPAGQATNVVFQGMSFYGFTGVSTQAYGATGSKITFNDVKWQDFTNGATAVHQTNPNGGSPMEVVISKGAFATGVGSNLIDNVGGTLTVSDLDVIESVTADSVIRTSEGGTSGLSNFKATLSNIVRVTYTTGGGKHTINSFSVTGMQSMGSVLFVEGSGSALTASNVMVTDNKLFAAYQAQTSRNFNVIVGTDSAIANINDVTVTGNDGMDRVFSANDGAVVSITDATVSDCIGTSPPDLLSNIGIAEDGGSLNLLRLQTSNIEEFSSVYFATCGSSIQAVQSCVSNSKLSSYAFVSFDSTFSGSGNFIDTDSTDSTTCRDDQTVVVYKENNLGSSCFSTTGTGVCEGTCVAGFSDSTDCLAGNPSFSMTPTPSPGGAAGNPSCPASPPTPAPTLAPGTSPGSTASTGGGDDTPMATTPPQEFGTVPPGQGGSGTNGGDGGGGSENGGDNGGGGNGGGGNGGSGSAATATSSNLIFVQMVAALFLARLVHGVLF